MAALRGWNAGVSLWVDPALFTRGMWQEEEEHGALDTQGWKCPSDFLRWHTIDGFQVSKEGWQPA